MTNKDYLIASFRKAYVEGYNYVGISVMMEGFSEVEFIVNPYENILGKLDYYLHAYDDNLYHKFADGVRIVAIWTMEDDKWYLEGEMG